MVVGAPELEGAILIQTDSQTNPGGVILFVKAGGAVTRRASLSAGITADAAVELGKPEFNAFSR
jgi:hypothetical protein